MKVTQWFLPKQKPMHVGWYQCLWHDGSTGMRWWTKDGWLMCPGSHKSAFNVAGLGRGWSGLSERPK